MRDNLSKGSSSTSNLDEEVRNVYPDGAICIIQTQKLEAVRLFSINIQICLPPPLRVFFGS